jgi:hypothetical protein
VSQLSATDCALFSKANIGAPERTVRIVCHQSLIEKWDRKTSHMARARLEVEAGFRAAIHGKGTEVLRLEAGEWIAAVSDELKIRRKLLYEWRAAYRMLGVAGLNRKRGRKPGGGARASPGITVTL